MLDRHQRRYLRRHVCWLCEQRLDRIAGPGDCSGIGPRCDQAVIDQRRAACLAHYKPRPARRRKRKGGLYEKD